uniref:Uncharacterized protein n=1 Tax=Rhizophagus irregularis (strain DAOM 181602 / DAOM 197198 / MUCL 43194) TaxID=747089 RepID=U9TI25_RHIID
MIIRLADQGNLRSVLSNGITRLNIFNLVDIDSLVINSVNSVEIAVHLKKINCIILFKMY